MKEGYCEYLKKHREMRCYTQWQISRVLNLSHSAYGLIELGRRRLPAEYAFKLAEFYGITIDELLGTDGRDKHG